MYKNVKIGSATEPAAFVTKGKQRVKQYGKNLYLKNGDQFELELFNPLNYKVLAKIKLNGFYLESGIVLRPGERVFLERHLDQAKKFKFETYIINSNDVRAKEAILYNGNVEVEFYSEILNGPLMIHYGPPYISSNGTAEWNFSTDHTIQTSYSTNYNCSSNSAEFEETGRIEKGQTSNQEFEYDGSSFNSWYTWKTEWKILPDSKKAFVKEDLSTFCVNCGAKRKKDSFKFCPHCGKKYS